MGSRCGYGCTRRSEAARTRLCVWARRRVGWSAPVQLRSTRQWVGSFCCGVAGACIDTALHLAGTRNGLMNSFGF